ncbi:MAG: hypothetical protein SOY99_04285 [Alloprevotella sp.]|nr:hypothetical protein [Bacteroidales bacterium]MDY3943429.1 hypothetical protein [Alloprevotella sp.]
MKISRERILQLDIRGFVKRCDSFREKCLNLKVYDEVLELLRGCNDKMDELEEERCFTTMGEFSTYETEEYQTLQKEWERANRKREDLEWVVFEVAKRLGVYLGQDEWNTEYYYPLNFRGEDLSKEFAKMNKIKDYADFILIADGIYQAQLWMAVNDVMNQKEWKQKRRRMFDAGADEIELQRLESTDFPVAYLIMQGEIYGELRAGANDWAEVVEQLAELYYYKGLAVGLKSGTTPIDYERDENGKRKPYEQIFAEWCDMGKFERFNGSVEAISKFFSKSTGCSMGSAKNYYSRREELKQKWIDK